MGEKRKQLKKYYFIAMCLAGFASSAQYLMVGAGIIPCLLILENKDFIKTEKIKIILIGIFIAGITFFVFNPYILLNIDTVLSDLKRAGSFYSLDFFNIKAPVFALWMWAIGIGFIAIPLTLGFINKFNIKSFIKKYNYFIITIILFGYYGSVMCISLGFIALTTRFFIPVILLTSILILFRINTIKNAAFRKTVFCLLFFASLANVYIMKAVLNEGKSPTRPYIEASKYFNNIYHKYDTVFSSHITPAPYITPACSMYCNIKPWEGGKLKKK